MLKLAFRFILFAAFAFLPASIHAQDRSASALRTTAMVRLENSGDSFSRNKKWEMAAACYADLIKLAPQNAQYHYKYGGALAMEAQQCSIFRAVSMVDDIEGAFLNAIRIDPGHINARWALIELYLRLPGILGGSEKKAMRYAAELQDLSQVDGFLAKGRICEYYKRFNDAEKYYRKAFDAGHSKICCDKLSSLYEKMGQPGKAASVKEDYEIQRAAGASAANPQFN